MGRNELNEQAFLPPARKLVLEYLGGMARGIVQNNDGLFGDAFSKLLKDYESTPEQFDALIEESLAQQRQSAAAVFEARQTMLKSVTPEEWSAIVAAAQRENEGDAKKAAEKAAKKAKKS